MARESKGSQGATWFLIRQGDSPSTVLVLYELARLCGCTYKGQHKTLRSVSLSRLSQHTGIHERRLRAILARLMDIRACCLDSKGFLVNPRLLRERHRMIARRGYRAAGWWSIGRVPEVMRESQIRPRGRLLAGIAQHRYEQDLKAIRSWRKAWQPSIDVLAKILHCCRRTVKRVMDRVLPMLGLRGELHTRPGSSARFVHLMPALSYSCTGTESERQKQASSGGVSVPEISVPMAGGEAILRNILFELVGKQRHKLAETYARPRRPGAPCYAEE